MRFLPTPPLILIILFFILLLSAAFTWMVLYCAKRFGWIAIPNERSSHTTPTPSSGGIAIAIAFFLSILAFYFSNVIETNLALAFTVGGIFIAAIGWLDDRYDLHPAIRILIHIVAASAAIWFLGGGPTSLQTGAFTIPLGIWGSIFGVIGIVWASNFYNFMDGIDGLAASETVMIGGLFGILLFFTGSSSLAVIAWSLTASAGGFLLWNWQPAKIFMGDTGSVLIGFSFAVLALASEKTGGVPLLLWIMALGICVIDATTTTLYRLWRGERWFEAHRTFAYQRAVARGYRHSRVVIHMLGLNVFLLAMVALSLLEPRIMLLSFTATMIILVFIWRNIQRGVLFPLQKQPLQ